MPPRLQPPASCARRRLACRLVFALWLAYSGALLGWHAFDAPPAGSCIVR